MLTRLIEALEAAKDAAEAFNEAAYNLQETFDNINEEMDTVEIDHGIRETIIKMVSNEPVLEQGTPVREAIDFILEALPEDDNEFTDKMLDGLEEEEEDNFNDY